MKLILHHFKHIHTSNAVPRRLFDSTSKQTETKMLLPSAFDNIFKTKFFTIEQLNLQKFSKSAEIFV